MKNGWRRLELSVKLTISNTVLGAFKMIRDTISDFSLCDIWLHMPTRQRGNGTAMVVQKKKKEKF